MDDAMELKGLGAGKSLLIFGAAGFILYLESDFLIPWLSETTGIETVVFWFLVAGLGMFLPLTMLPILFIQSLAVQKTKNTWTGVLIHAVINGTSFIAIALGLL